MTVLFENQQTNTSTSPVTESEDINRQIIVSGTPGGAIIDLYVQSDDLRAVAAKRFITGQVRATFKSGTKWWLQISKAGSDTDLDCSYL